MDMADYTGLADDADTRSYHEKKRQINKMEVCRKIAQGYLDANPTRKFKRNLTQDEAGAVDQIASVIDNVGFKHGQELHKRVVQGYDTRREYWSDCALYGPFGTEDAPVYVPANDNHRFVGCLGGYEGTEEHELVWFLVRQGPKPRCPTPPKTTSGSATSVCPTAIKSLYRSG